MGVSLVKVVVRDGNIQKALQVFKKKVMKSGHIEELKRRREYTKPTTERRLEKEKAKRKNHIMVQKEKLIKKLGS
jgi:small subunit ribosomal protein S21